MELNFFYAKHKHKMWKMRLKAFLLGLEDFDENKITSSDDCDLGKWINEYAKEAYKDFPEMEELIQIHDKIHEIVKEIPTLKKKNKLQEANQKYELLKKESDRLLQKLGKIEQREKQLLNLDKENQLNPQYGSSI